MKSASKDKLTKARRSWNMSRIRSKDTTPERIVRSMLHKMGYRFRLHVRIEVAAGTLKGQTKRFFIRPDIILPKYKTAIFVHGCFWHRHHGCKNCTTPTNRRDFWVAKLEGNAVRDKVHFRALKELGWSAIVVWQCEINSTERRRRTMKFLREQLDIF